MMTRINGSQMRKVLLEVVKQYSHMGPSMQSGSILNEAARRLRIKGDTELEQALLTFWYDLFRIGLLCWGYDLSNAGPPFCHLTEQGRRTLQTLSRDPANPDGYLNYLSQSGTLNSIAQSYVEEALKTYNADCFKAAAVMIGAATESIILELRDILVDRIQASGQSPSKKLKSWKIKEVLDAVGRELESRKAIMPKKLAEDFESYWPAFTQQIRAARNDAGHPSNINPLTLDRVHASLLIFPELVKLACALKSWMQKNI